MKKRKMPKGLIATKKRVAAERRVKRRGGRKEDTQNGEGMQSAREKLHDCDCIFTEPPQGCLCGIKPVPTPDSCCAIEGSAC